MIRVVILAGALGLCGPVNAMSIAEAGPPLGLPPEGFEGLQFVDRRGCLYIRTGNLERPDWVPRVRRTGDVICGLEPSFPAVAVDAADNG